MFKLAPLGPQARLLLSSILSVVSITKHSKTKTEARSTQISKTKHPRSKRKDPKSRKRSTKNSKTKTPKSRKRSTQKLETGLSFINTRPTLIQQESSTIANRMQFKSTQVVNHFRGCVGGRCFGRDQKTENAQTISRMKVKNDHRSKFSNLSNWKEEAWKKSGLQRESNPWPSHCRCVALPTELWSYTLGARSIYWVHISREEWNDVKYMK